MSDFSNSIHAVVQRLSVSRPTVNRLIAAGKLKARKLGSRTIILESDLLDYINRLPVVAPSRMAAAA